MIGGVLIGKGVTFVITRKFEIMKKLTLLGLALLPSTVFAADLEVAINNVAEIVNVAVTIIVTLIIIFFFWGLLKYIQDPGSEDWKKRLVWSVLALFVMVGIWGIVQIVGDTFGVETGGPAPDVKVPKANTN